MSSKAKIRSSSRITGETTVPGDKSLSHRVAMLAAIAEGTSRIRGFASSADCAATLDCVSRLGIGVEKSGSEVLIHGRGLGGLSPSPVPVQLYAANSGSTIRMLSGILAGQRFSSVIDGDSSLRRRPMRRIMDPLELMGARIEARDGKFAPLSITGGRLNPIDYTSQVASAQVKTCVLFAGLYADGVTSFREPAVSRNHTELMLPAFGAGLTIEDGRLSIQGGTPLQPVNYDVPGDLSSAAFLLAAAALLKDSDLAIRGVNLNPTRTAFIDVLNGLGAGIKKENVVVSHGEPVGDLISSGAWLKSESTGTTLRGDLIPNIIDEIPVLAVVATQVEGRVEVRDARELRIKESDRIRTVVDAIRKMGGEIEEFEDGFAVAGPQKLTGASIDSCGDHRIAMAFTIAGLVASGTTEILGAESAAVSFPEFYSTIQSLSDEESVTLEDEE